MISVTDTLDFAAVHFFAIDEGDYRTAPQREYDACL